MKKLVTGGVLAGLFLFVGVARAATLAPAPSPCDVVGTPFLTITQPITEPDSGNNGDWATDTFTENVKVWVGTDNTTFCANGTTNDGTFVTTGSSSPGAGTSLLAGITGTFTGGENWVLPAGTATTTSDTSLTLDADNSSVDSQFSNWQSHVFTQTAGASTYAFTYIVDGNPADTWTNADSVSNPPTGNSGDITNPSALSTVYVDGVNGNDTTNVGSQAAPFKTLQAAVDAVADNGTVNLLSDLTISSEVTLNRAVTIDGAGHHLNATFAKTDSSNNAAIGILHSGVTVKNLIEDGTGSTALHGINIFEATGVTLDGVTLSHNGHDGVVVNGSTVTANNITTLSNAWDGIDVDLGSGVAGPASLAVTGVSHHTEANADIKIDDVTKNVSVTDTNNQYSSSLTGNTKVYKLKTIIDASAPEVVITNPTAPVSVTIDAGTTNPTINFDALVTNGTGTLPATTIDSATTNVAIPAATVVTSTDTSWNGVIAAPTVVSAPAVTADAGQTATAISAIEIGAGDTPLTFSKAVRLAFAGQAGNSIGWSQAGSFHAITDTCAADDQATNDLLASGADCKIDVGPDLIVWTKHFTTFVTYTQAPILAVSGGSSLPPESSPERRAANLASLGLGGGTGVNAGQVLGAFTGPEGTNIDSPQVIAIKTQLASLIKQLIAMLQSQLAAAIASGTY